MASERNALMHVGHNGAKKLFFIIQSVPEKRCQAQWQRKEQNDEYLGFVIFQEQLSHPSIQWDRVCCFASATSIAYAKSNDSLTEFRIFHLGIDSAGFQSQQNAQRLSFRAIQDLHRIAAQD